MPRIPTALAAGFIAWFPIRFVLSHALDNVDNAAYFAVVGAIIVFAIVSSLLLKPSTVQPARPVETPALGGALVASLAAGAVTALAGRREDEDPLESAQRSIGAVGVAADAAGAVIELTVDAGEAAIDAGTSLVSGVLDLLEEDD